MSAVGTSLEGRLCQWAKAGFGGRAGEDSMVSLCAGHTSGTPPLGPGFQNNGEEVKTEMRKEGLGGGPRLGARQRREIRTESTWVGNESAPELPSGRMPLTRCGLRM